MPSRRRTAMPPSAAKAMTTAINTANCTTGPAVDNPSAVIAPGNWSAPAGDCSAEAMPIAIAPPKTAVETRSNDIRDCEPDLRGHHHQIHVPPRWMVLRRGQLVGVAHDQPDRVPAPQRQEDAQDLE